MNLPLLPIGRATASDIRHIKEPGLLFPTRDRDETLLLTPLGGQMHCIMLTGTHAFMNFPVSLQSPHYGLFVPDVEILVDYGSAADGSRFSENHGVLVLRQNELLVVSTRAGNDFHGPQPFPLWTSVEGGSDTCKVAFTKWGIAVRDGDERITLWEHSIGAKSTVEVFG